MKKGIIIGVGVVGVAGALAYYFYNKNKTAASSAALPGQSATTLPSAATTTTSTPSPVPAVKQTMWKDVEGNVWEILTSRGKYGFNVKKNGSIITSMEVFFQDPDGYMMGADNHGSLYRWKDNKWNLLVGNNKSGASAELAKYGQAYLNGLSGIGNAFLLS